MPSKCIKPTEFQATSSYYDVLIPIALRPATASSARETLEKGSRFAEEIHLVS